MIWRTGVFCGVMSVSNAVTVDSSVLCVQCNDTTSMLLSQIYANYFLTQTETLLAGWAGKNTHIFTNIVAPLNLNLKSDSFQLKTFIKQTKRTV